MKKRVFVLDTNVLLHDPESPLHFANENVLIPIQVVEEVDGFKRGPREKGHNARRVSRLLDNPREKGNLSSGVKINNKIVFTGDPNQIDHPYLDSDSNGLTWLAKKLHGQKIIRDITLSPGERGDLPELEADLL